MRQVAVIIACILFLCRLDVGRGAAVDQRAPAASQRGPLLKAITRRQWEAAFGGLGGYNQNQPDYNSYDIHRDPWQTAPGWNSNNHDAFAYGSNSDGGFEESEYEYDDDEDNDDKRSMNVRRVPHRPPQHRRPSFTKVTSKRAQRTETDQTEADGKRRLVKALENLKEAARKLDE